MPEMIVVMLIAVLMFGKRLPEVGRSLGKGIIEFKKGLRGIEDEFPSVAPPPAEPYEPHRSTDLVQTSVPKFEPPTMAPVAHTGYEPQPTQD